MLKNADCTIWSKNSRTRHVIRGVYWSDNRGRTVTKNGTQINDSVLVYIYDNTYMPQAEDLIVKGVSDFEFDTTSGAAESTSMQQFRAAYPQFATVKNVTDCWYGGLPHIEVIAR